MAMKNQTGYINNDPQAGLGNLLFFLRYLMKPLALTIAFLIGVSSQAEVKRLCKVSCGNWAQIMEVEFASGNELNEATHTYKYSTFNTYALVWFSQHEVAILKIQSPSYYLGSTFGPKEFKQNFTIITRISAIQVNGDTSRSWQIETHRGFPEIGWIDPRVDEPYRSPTHPDLPLDACP
jgi:hypothetical protein